MKRIPIYIILIALVFIAPVRRVDVGTLEPVEIIAVSKESGLTLVRTDTDDVGIGKSIEQALEDLKQTATGVVYLDTAEFLLLAKGCEAEGQQLKKWLADSVRVCATQGELDLKAAVKYLRAHGMFPKLSQWKLNEKLPVLTSDNFFQKNVK